jgi:hypothetical protein
MEEKLKKLKNSERAELKDNVINFKYYNSKDELMEDSCKLEKITSFYIKKLEAISTSKYTHQKDIKKTAKQILKILEEKVPEYFI